MSRRRRRRGGNVRRRNWVRSPSPSGWTRAEHAQKPQTTLMKISGRYWRLDLALLGSPNLARTVDVEDAFQVVDLMLQDARQPAIGLDARRLSTSVDALHGHCLVALDLAQEARDRLLLLLGKGFFIPYDVLLYAGRVTDPLERELLGAHVGHHVAEVQQQPQDASLGDLCAEDILQRGHLAHLARQGLLVYIQDLCRGHLIDVVGPVHVLIQPPQGKRYERQRGHGQRQVTAAQILDVYKK